MSDQDEQSVNIPLYRQGVREVVKKVVDDQVGRDRWEVDYEIYDQQDEEDKLNDPIYSRSTRTLQARTGHLGIDNDIGRKKFVIKDGPKKDQAGFHCQTCDENFLDSDSWLNHLNSRKHNRLLGMNLKVDKVDAHTVKEKLESLKKTTTYEPVKIQSKQETLQEIQKKIEEDMMRKKEKKLQKLQMKNIMNDQLDKITQQKKSKQNDNSEEEDDEQIRELQRLGLPVSFKSKRIKK